MIMTGKRILRLAILLINFFGILCLVYYGFKYLSHDTTVANPDAMLALEGWDAGGFALTIGLLPLFLANLAAYLTDEEKGWKKALFFLPCIICLLTVSHYWFCSFNGAAQAVVRLQAMDTGEEEYLLVYDNGSTGVPEGEPQMKEAVYTAPGSSFALAGGGNILDEKALEAADETVRRILQLIAAGEAKTIREVRVFEDDGIYFAAVILEGSLEELCHFYIYHKDEDRIRLLETWNHWEVTGVTAAKE